MRKSVSVLFIMLLLQHCDQSTKSDLSVVNHTKIKIEKAVIVDNRGKKEGEDTTIIEVVSHGTGDPMGNFYFMNPTIQTIYSVDKNGDQRWKTGSRGDDIGQFYYVSSLAYDQTKDKLILFDIFKSAVTEMDTYGNVISYIPINKRGFRIDQIRLFDRYDFVAMTQWDDSSRTLVSVYDKVYKELKFSLMHVDEISDIESVIVKEKLFSKFYGSIHTVENKLIYTPFIYNGRLMVTEYDDENWNRTDDIIGYELIDRPIVLHPSDKAGHKRSHMLIKVSENKYLHAEYKSLSLGIYDKGADQIVHLSYRLQEGDNWSLIAEFFDKSTLKMIDYYQIDDVLKSFKVTSFPLWYSPNDEIYMVENSKTPLYKLSLSKSWVNVFVD